jgi:DNA-binding IclR family transcriptional regulator
MEKNETKVLGIIESSDAGRTITEIVALSRLPRSVVRILLARLEGAGKVSFRKVGMAKIYVVNKDE